MRTFDLESHDSPQASGPGTCLPDCAASFRIAPALSERSPLRPRTTKVQYNVYFKLYTLKTRPTFPLAARQTGQDWEIAVKNTIAAVVIVSCALISLPCTWAQGNSAASSPTGAEHPDEIVRMHQQVAAANREYKRELAAAKKAYDQKKAAADKKRDAAVAAAQQGVNQ